jgi:hypothetical protein
MVALIMLEVAVAIGRVHLTLQMRLMVRICTSLVAVVVFQTTTAEVAMAFVAFLMSNYICFWKLKKIKMNKLKKVVHFYFYNDIYY